MAAAQTVDGVVGTWDKDVVVTSTPARSTGSRRCRGFRPADRRVKNSGRRLRIKIVADTHIGYAYSTQHLVAEGIGSARR